MKLAEKILSLLENIEKDFDYEILNYIAIKATGEGSLQKSEDILKFSSKKLFKKKPEKVKQAIASIDKKVKAVLRREDKEISDALRKILSSANEAKDAEFSGGGLFNIGIVLYDMHSVLQTMGNDKLAKQVLSVSDDIDKKSKERLTKDELNGIFKRYDLPNIFKKVQTAFKEYDNGGKSIFVKHKSGRIGVTIDLPSLLIRFPKSVKEAERFYSNLSGVSLRESKTDDALAKALASIGKQFGKGTKEDDKKSFRELLLSSKFYDELRKRRKDGSEFFLSSKDLGKIFQDYNITKEDYEHYKTWAKNFMDGIYKRYTNSPSDKWDRLDKLYKMMPKYREIYKP